MVTMTFLCSHHTSLPLEEADGNEGWARFHKAPSQNSCSQRDVSQLVTDAFSLENTPCCWWEFCPVMDNLQHPFQAKELLQP